MEAAVKLCEPIIIVQYFDSQKMSFMFSTQRVVMCPVHVCVSHAGSLDWVHICRTASKVVTFIDLAGHEKYLKTTIFGMTGHAPDFCMLMVGSNAGVIGMTKGDMHNNMLI